MLHTQALIVLHALHVAPEPDGQLRHCVTPVDGLYVPIGQATQVVAVVAAVMEEYIPIAQSVQETVPVAVLYFPGAHAVQFPVGPV